MTDFWINLLSEAKSWAMLRKNPRIWKIQKLFFMDLRFTSWTYIQTSFRLKNHQTTSSSQAGCVCRIFVNRIFTSCHYNIDQMKQTFLSDKYSIERLHIDKKRSLICSFCFRQLIEIWFTKIWQTHLAWLEEVAWDFWAGYLFVCKFNS